MKRCSFVSLLIALTIFTCVLSAYPQPTDNWLNEFRYVTAVRIIVNESYGRASGVSLPFEDVTRRIGRICWS